MSKAKAGVSMYIRMHCVCYGAIPQVKRVKKEDGDDDDDEFKVCVLAVVMKFDWCFTILL